MMKDMHKPVEGETLDERERRVLHLVVKHYVASAAPVGSEFLVRRGKLPWSSATIRNVFARLEELDYIEHPHTSAGRMPTEKGYRFFVNTMEEAPLSRGDAGMFEELRFDAPNPEPLLREVTQLLGKISGQLSLLAASYTSTGILHRIDLIPLSSTRILAVLAVRSGYVKSVVLEVRTEIPAGKLEQAARALTERLHGRTLAELRAYSGERLRAARGMNDHSADAIESSIVRMIFDAPGVFDDPFDAQSVFVGGVPDAVLQPEFRSGEQLHHIMELIADEPSVAGILYEHHPPPDAVAVRIGSEHADERLHGCGTIAAQYRRGDLTGMVGIVGPTRLQYDRLAPLVSYLARSLSTAAA